MKKLLVLTLLAVLTFATQAFACFNPTDSFAVEAVLNKTGINYDLSFIKASDNLVIDEGALVYQSHYDNRVAVILEEINAEIGNGKILRGLSVKLQIPTERVAEPYVSASVFQKGVNMQNFDEAFLQSLGYKVEDDGIEDETHISLKKDNIEIDIYDHQRAGEEYFSIYVTVKNTETLDESTKDDLGQIISSLGLDEEILNELLASTNIQETEDLTEAVDISKDDFDFKSAMKTELDWLMTNGIVVGITNEDITTISTISKAGLAGWNSRIIFDEKWIPFYESSSGVFIDRGNGCGGFDLLKMPEGQIVLPVTSVSPNSKIISKWGEIKSQY